MEGDPRYAELSVVEALPFCRFAPEGGEELLRRMAGATIMRIGSTNEDGIEGGGLIIDYMPRGSSETMRVVFAFNASALWVEWEGLVQSASTPGVALMLPKRGD